MALKRISVVLLVMVAMFMLSCNCTKEDEEVVGKTQEAKHKEAEMEREAKEASESWAEWAKEKISLGRGLKADETKESAKTASDDASGAEKARDTNNVASDLPDKAKDTVYTSSEKASDFANAAMEKARQAKDAVVEKASDLANAAKEKAGVGDITNAAKEKAQTVPKDSATESAKEAKDRAAKTAEEAKEKAEENKKKQAETEEQVKWAKSKAAGETVEGAKQKSQELKDKLGGPGRDEEL